MESLCSELKVEIFKSVSTPMSLVLLNRNWYSTSQYSHARAEWLIYKYGRAHALFHAIRLGRNFITVEVVQALLAKKAVISRYFIQRLMMQFGTLDSKLIEMRTTYNMNNNNIPKNPWGSNIPESVLIKLLTEATNELKDIAIRGNDMELFHYLTAGTKKIHEAQRDLTKNLQDIEDLILKKKFIPFPPRHTSAHVTVEYPSHDGYENNRQVNLISRAILVYPELVKLWKEIGYNEICSDTNELVLRGTLLIYFPLNPPNNWECPSADIVAEKLQVLINLGFQLNDEIIEDSISLFESRIKIIGESLLNSFIKVQGNLTSNIVRSKLTEIRSVDVEKERRKKRRTY